MNTTSTPENRKTPLSQRVLAAEMATQTPSSKNFPTFETAKNAIKGFLNPNMIFDQKKLEKKAQIDKENEIERNELRRGFLDQFAINLNPDSPAKDKMSRWTYDTRYSFANIISPDGFCYVLNVENSKEHRKIFSSFMQKLGIEQGSLTVYEPVYSQGAFTPEQIATLQNKNMIDADTMWKFTPKRLRSSLEKAS